MASASRATIASWPSSHASAIRVEVYLQFDGFELETHLFHRGEDLREMKAEAIRRLTGERIFTTLAMAVAKGVNDHEVGAVVDYAFATDYIAGVAIQPMFTAGRANPVDPMDRATTTGTIRRLGEQTGQRVGPADFIALPCSHPDCSSLTYFIRGDDGAHRSIVQLIGRDRLKARMAVFGNRLAPDDALWESLTGLLSETAMVSRREVIDYLLDICEVCDLGVSGFIKSLGRWLTDRGSAPIDDIALRVKRLSIKTFMDPWTMNVERLQQCCVHVGSTDGEANPVRIPFCARQVFGQLRRQTSAGMVPAARLIQLDAPERASTACHDQPARGGPHDAARARFVRSPALEPTREVRAPRLHVLPHGHGRAHRLACFTGGVRARGRRHRRRALRTLDHARRVVEQVLPASADPDRRLLGRRRGARCVLDLRPGPAVACLRRVE